MRGADAAAIGKEMGRKARSSSSFDTEAAKAWLRSFGLVDRRGKIIWTAETVELIHSLAVEHLIEQMLRGSLHAAIFLAANAPVAPKPPIAVSISTMSLSDVEAEMQAVVRGLLAKGQISPEEAEAALRSLPALTEGEANADL